MSPSVEPFNEAKYKALMDGLEIVEIPFKELATIIDYRIESEYFSKKADGVIIGNAIVKIIEKYSKTSPGYVYNYVKEMKNAIIRR